jgi:hypothetical protein
MQPHCRCPLKPCKKSSSRTRQNGSIRDVRRPSATPLEVGPGRFEDRVVSVTITRVKSPGVDRSARHRCSLRLQPWWGCAHIMPIQQSE